MKGKMINNKGFSLVELVIIIAIMSILAVSISAAIIRYIDKARRAVDVQTAETIFNAANLAAASADDNVAAGWAICENHDDGYAAVTLDGYRAPDEYRDGRKTSENTYVIRPVAWARGVNYTGDYSEWENSLFKATLDGAGGDAKLQRCYTDDFLANLFHEDAQGGYNAEGHRNYDGENMQTLSIRFKKLIKLTARDVQFPNQTKLSSYDGRKRPECWIVYRRDDNGATEIWIGYKGSGTWVEPLYRLYPDPCDAYR